MTGRPVFVLTLRAEPGVNSIQALRAALKALRRTYGLKCIRLTTTHGATMTTELKITPRELRKGECWTFRAYGHEIEVGWNGRCWAVVDDQRFGPFGTEAEATLAAIAYAKDRQRVPSGEANGADAVTAA